MEIRTGTSNNIEISHQSLDITPMVLIDFKKQPRSGMVPMILTLLFVLTVFQIPSVTAQQWEQLFDGTSMKGWTIKGGRAIYEVKDGAIVGSTVKGGPNTFLCTAKDYGDFILELEFFADPGINSGVQIRSESKKEIRNGTVFGYQVEIDTSQRAWSGGIYDESRRGWINNLKDNEPARKAFKQGQWNHYRIHCFGNHIRTWINGVPAANLRDSATLKGFIALQVHGTNSDKTMQVKWRNIRILDLGHSEWEPLWNGKDFSGWNPLPGGKWSIEDGVIRGTSEKSEKRHGILLSENSFKDFAVKFDFKVDKGDSGFYFRTEPVNGNVSVRGFQIEVDTTFETGGLYETGGRGWVVKHERDKKHSNYRQGQWNQMALSAHGKDVVVHLNGRKSAELKNDKGRTKGHFGLQLHGSQDMDVSYKNIHILRHVPKLP